MYTTTPQLLSPTMYEKGQFILFLLVSNISGVLNSLFDVSSVLFYILLLYCMWKRKGTEREIDNLMINLLPLEQGEERTNPTLFQLAKDMYLVVLFGHLALL